MLPTHSSQSFELSLWSAGARLLPWVSPMVSLFCCVFWEREVSPSYPPYIPISRRISCNFTLASPSKTADPTPQKHKLTLPPSGPNVRLRNRNPSLERLSRRRPLRPRTHSRRRRLQSSSIHARSPAAKSGQDFLFGEGESAAVRDDDEVQRDQ